MSAGLEKIVKEFEKETKDFSVVNEGVAQRAFDAMKRFVDNDEFKLQINSNAVSLTFCEDEAKKDVAWTASNRFNVMVGVFDGVTRRHFYYLMLSMDPLGTDLEFHIGAERMKLLNQAALDKFMCLCKVAYGSSSRRELLVKHFIQANLEHAKAFKMLFEFLEPSVGFKEVLTWLTEAV